MTQDVQAARAFVGDDAHQDPAMGLQSDSAPAELIHAVFRTGAHESLKHCEDYKQLLTRVRTLSSSRHGPPGGTRRYIASDLSR